MKGLFEGSMLGNALQAGKALDSSILGELGAITIDACPFFEVQHRNILIKLFQ